ncbi:hypothetical protein TELCIR_01033 [Teladorsagia circumcincta]|uniref:Uncharacterized protein n=1 Tax=Teladorsagia circumcincta TaxID=45464 RepID=A0A2G9V314_TELCI|nr:hypothetical protein TELCIR_01033 [Teladorsagia circumcincta]
MRDARPTSSFLISEAPHMDFTRLPTEEFRIQREHCRAALNRGRTAIENHVPALVNEEMARVRRKLSQRMDAMFNAKLLHGSLGLGKYMAQPTGDIPVTTPPPCPAPNRTMFTTPAPPSTTSGTTLCTQSTISQTSPTATQETSGTDPTAHSSGTMPAWTVTTTTATATTASDGTDAAQTTTTATATEALPSTFAWTQAASLTPGLTKTVAGDGDVPTMTSSASTQQTASSAGTTPSTASSGKAYTSSSASGQTTLSGTPSGQTSSTSPYCTPKQQTEGLFTFLYYKPI